MKVTFEVEPKEFVEMTKEFIKLSTSEPLVPTQLQDWATYKWPNFFTVNKGEDK